MKLFSSFAPLFLIYGCFFPESPEDGKSNCLKINYVNNTKYTVGISGNLFIIKPGETYEDISKTGGSYDPNYLGVFDSYSEVTVYTSKGKKLCYKHTPYTNNKGNKVRGPFEDPERYTAGIKIKIEKERCGEESYLRTFTFTQADVNKAKPCNKGYTLTYKYVNNTKYDINFRDYFNIKPKSSHEITGQIIGYDFDSEYPIRRIAIKDFIFDPGEVLPKIIYTYQDEILCYHAKSLASKKQPYNITGEENRYTITKLEKDKDSYPHYLLTFTFSQSDLDFAGPCE